MILSSFYVSALLTHIMMMLSPSTSVPDAANEYYMSEGEDVNKSSEVVEFRQVEDRSTFFGSDDNDDDDDNVDDCARHLQIYDYFANDLKCPANEEKFILPSGVCEGKVLCDKIPNYPIDEVRSAIRSEEEKYIQWFGTDPDPVSPISARIAETQSELCASRQQMIYPQVAHTSYGLLKVIVNDGEVYRQGIWIEVCGKENSECEFSRSFPNGYRTKCVQKYAIRQMVAIGDDGKPHMDHFRIPACCACAVTGPIF